MILCYVISLVYLATASSEIIYETNFEDKSQTALEEYIDGDNSVNVIQGLPGKDYPNYSVIPETSFSCIGKSKPGYYVDVEADCQVFHICLPGGVKTSFLCPNGSLFNQMYSVCDWWYDVNCDSTVGIIHSLDDVLKIQDKAYNIYDYSEDNGNNFYLESNPDDLHLQSSGRNIHPNGARQFDENNAEKFDTYNHSNYNEITNSQQHKSENHPKSYEPTSRRYSNKMVKKLESGHNITNVNTQINKNNETSLNFVNLLKSDQIAPPKRLESHNNNKNRNHIALDVTLNNNNGNEIQFDNFGSFHYRGDVSDLRNSQNDAFYGSSVQNTFNRNYQPNSVLSTTISYNNEN